MNVLKNILTGMIALFFLINFSAAQEAATQEMTKDAWNQAMQEATVKRDQLRKDIENLDKEIARLKERDAQLAAETQKEEAELTALFAEAKAFEERLKSIEATIAELEQLSKRQLARRAKDLDTVQSLLAEAWANQLAERPLYKGQLDALQQRFDKLRPPTAQQQSGTAGEVVVGTWAEDRACLWNIAKDQSVYGDPALWVKLWQGNKEKISDPDVLHPGQRLRVPAKAPLTVEEKTARDQYYSRKFAQSTQEEQ